MNLNPEAIDNFEVDAWSDSDAGGIDLTVTETNEATEVSSRARLLLLLLASFYSFELISALYFPALPSTALPFSSPFGIPVYLPGRSVFLCSQ
jgi:hypothetical protein